MAFIATLVNTTIYLVLSWQTLSHVALATWYFAFMSVLVVRTCEVRRCLRAIRHKMTSEQIDACKRRFDLGTFVSGLLWGLLGINVHPSMAASQQVLTIFLLAGISSGAVVSYSVSPQTTLLSILPTLIPLTVTLFSTHNPVYSGMGGMLILYVIFMAQLGRNLTLHNDQSISLTLERADLLNERNIHQAASKAKSVFLARISHELRTPLSSIIGYADRALRSEPNLRDPSLKIIRRSAEHLSAVVNDLLDMARIESGRILIERGWINTNDEIAAAVAMVSPAASQKELKIEVVPSHNVPQEIFTDANRFRQILVNLLTNAINFTDHGRTTIEPRLTANIENENTENKVELRVTDTGIGVKADVAKKIFEPFVRGEHKARSREPGTGLGLALSRDLALALGGDLWLEKSTPGQGSTFVFSLECRLSLSVQDSVSPPVKTYSRVPSRPLTGRRIMIAEDDEDLRDLLRWNLEEAGALVQTTSNGVDAVELALFNGYDTILMDIQMPLMNGDTATLRLRRQGYKKPVIALTAHASVDERKRCLEIGFTDYLSKPFEAGVLIETIRKHSA